jgi:hypothetical protein
MPEDDSGPRRKLIVDQPDGHRQIGKLLFRKLRARFLEDIIRDMTG